MAVSLKYNSHGQTYAVPRRRVFSIFELQSGDHIAFHQLRGLYWHHAIVEYIDVENGEIGVIHYSNTPKGFIRDNSSSPKRPGMARVVRDTYEFENEIVYLMIHKRCLDPETVVYKAQTRVGDGGYDPFTNNCEHFAMECKTGVSSSDQVNKGEEMVFNEVASKATQAGVREARGLTQTASRAGRVFTNRGVRVGTNQALSRCASRTGQEFLQRGSRAGIAFTHGGVRVATNQALSRCASRTGQEFLQIGSRAGITFAHGGVRVATNQALTRTAYASQTTAAAGIGGLESLAGGALIGAAVEGISVIHDIDRAHTDMVAGGISRSEFEDVVGKRILTGSMNVGGSVAGMIVGQALIPVPILGSVIGGTIGGIVGSLFGNTLANS